MTKNFDYRIRRRRRIFEPHSNAKSEKQNRLFENKLLTIFQRILFQHL